MKEVVRFLPGMRLFVAVLCAFALTACTKDKAASDAGGAATPAIQPDAVSDQEAKPAMAFRARKSMIRLSASRWSNGAEGKRPWWAE